VSVIQARANPVIANLVIAVEARWPRAADVFVVVAPTGHATAVVVAVAVVDYLVVVPLQGLEICHIDRILLISNPVRLAALWPIRGIQPWGLGTFCIPTPLPLVDKRASFLAQHPGVRSLARLEHRLTVPNSREVVFAKESNLRGCGVIGTPCA
jgi:hypothetical protein